MLQLTPEILVILRRAQAVSDRKAEEKAARKREQKHLQKLGDRRFKTLTDEIADVLREGEPTKFRMEGTCRHAVRSALVLQGWRWPDADRAAAEVVAASLRQIGAKRPSWMQGQPELRERDTTDWRYRHCPSCGGILEEDHRGRHCSDECLKVTTKRRWARENKEKVAASDRAWRAANPEKRRAIDARNRERQPFFECEHCAKPFQAKPKDRPRFCSPACGYAHRSASKAKAKQRQCAYCLGIFGNARSPDEQVFCSRSCSRSAKIHGLLDRMKCEGISP